MSKTSYYIYMVLCSDDTFYTGITTDLTRRIEEHNSSSKGAKYTKARRPVSLVYSEVHLDRSSASKRECQIKKMSRKEKKILINI